MEKKRCPGAENGHERAKRGLQGPLINIQPCMDFSLLGPNDHLMKVFIRQIYVNYSPLLNVSVLVYDSFRDVSKSTQRI